MNLRRFIRKWFCKNDLKAALSYKGLRLSGTIDVLIDRLRFEAKWSLYDFLDFMSNDELKDVCRWYDLTVSGRKKARIKRIYEFITSDWKDYDWESEHKTQKSGKDTEPHWVRRYDVFIAYRRDTGLDFARHLKNGLEREHIPAFLDIVDIPKEFKGKQTWIETRNKAIRRTEKFLLIITHRIETSKELKEEITIARDNDRTFMLYRDHTLSPQITIALEREKIDLSDFQQISFSSKEDLLRKVLTALK